jgi:hypothetical protein
MPSETSPYGEQPTAPGKRRPGWQHAVGLVLFALVLGFGEYARWHHVAIWLFAIVLLVAAAVGPMGFDLLGMRERRARALAARRQDGDMPLTFRKDWPRMFRSWSNYDLTTREQFRVAGWTVGCAAAFIVALLVVVVIANQ